MSRHTHSQFTSEFIFFKLFAALLLVLLLSGCLDEPPLPAGPTQTGISTDPGWYSLYFTDPQAPTARAYRGGPDSHLAEAIESARASVDMAAYDLDLWSLRDALIDAHRRGVAVRLVVESDQLDRPEFQDLITAGIPLLGDRREGLMHHKFVIIDRSEVWTGSMNFTLNGAYRNDNNLLRLRSSRLAADFLVEFEEMFTADRFGDRSLADTPYPSVTIEGVQVEVYFSPDDGVAARLVELVDAAESSIYFMAFSFTSDELAEALLARSAAGVVVSGVFEADQVESNTGGEYANLLQAGLDVRLDGNPKNMHHKVIILDERTVVTGSYNFSRSAETRNDENVLIIHDSAIASQYLAEFERVYGMSR